MMINPRDFEDILERYMAKITDEIELNLMIGNFDWKDIESRSSIILMIITMWESFKNEDGIVKKV